MKFIIPYSELNNHDHTIPIATRDVTYGKKYILWNIPLTFSFLILTSAFASKSEINTDKIGEMVMDKLKDIDEVSYVRFASVYRQFKDINTFVSELKNILMEKGD